MLFPLRPRATVLVLLCWASLGVFVGCARAQSDATTWRPDSGGALLPEQAAYDVTFYDLDVRVDPSTQTLGGTLGLRAAVTDTLRHLVLNLDARLLVDSVAVDGQAASFERRAAGEQPQNQLWIALPETRTPGESLSARVAYHGRPRVAPRPPWDGGLTWRQTPDGQPWIGTSVQTGGADLWWPVKDHPSDEPDSMALRFVVPAGLDVASNGRLVGREALGDSLIAVRYRVTTPINPYVVALHAAPYVRLDTTYASVDTRGGDSLRVPVHAWVLPGAEAKMRASLPGFLDQVRFLEETLGPYPFRADKYGVAHAPFLGMEHQTVIAYGHAFTDGGLGYDAGFDALHFHELAHEWYGNCLTVADWKDFWVHEGFATYLEALYAEALRGEEGYDALVRHFRRQLTHRAPIARRTPTSAQSIYGRDIYYKGALVLHTLRYALGEEAFGSFLRQLTYPTEAMRAATGGRQCRSVTTADVVAQAEAVAGEELGWFFDAYLYQAEPPRLATERTDERLTLRWTTPAEAPFTLPVEVEVDGTRQRVAMTGGQGTVPLPRPDAQVTLDPDGWLMR
jgi:aminopeptidase N